MELLPAESKVGADYDTELGPLATPPALARVLLVEGVIRPAIDGAGHPTVSGTDRLADLGERPVVFAANHHSHLDTPLMLSVIPEPWRHHLFVGAAADYFFANRVTATLSALVIGAIPIERTKVTRQSADQAAELIERRLEHAHLPRGRPQPRRLGPALPWRRGLHVDPLRRPRGAGARGGHRTHPAARARACPAPRPPRVTFGDPMLPGDGEDARRMAARIERAVAAAGRRSRQRLVAAPGDGPTPERTPLAAGADSGGMAPDLGPRRPPTRSTPTPAQLARGLTHASVGAPSRAFGWGHHPTCHRPSTAGEAEEDARLSGADLTESS